MLRRPDHALFTVQVQVIPTARLAKCRLRWHASGGGLEKILDCWISGARNIPLVQSIRHRIAMYSRQMRVQQVRAFQLAQNGHNATGAMNILHMHVRFGRRDFGQARHFARKTVDITHLEINARLIRCGKQVQNSIGRTTHGDIEGHGIFKCLKCRNIARQYAVVILFIIATAQFDRQ